jgi:copper chaperone CopZ
MKKNSILIILLLFLSKNGLSQLVKIELQATGLTCSMCSLSIQKQLQTIHEVDSIYTNIETSTYFIRLKKNNNLNPNIFKEKVEKAGFFVGNFIATANIDVMDKNLYILIDDCKLHNTEVKFQVIDKGFVTAKEFKKLSKQYKSILTYTANSENDFHIKLIEP